MNDSFKDSTSGQLNAPSKIPSSNVFREMGLGAWGIPQKNVSSHSSSHTSLFSSSLPILSHDKLNVTESRPSDLSVDDSWPSLGKLCIGNESKDALKDGESNVIDSLLPDEDDLFAGVMDDFDLSGLPNQLEDLEEYDIFGTGGGMEMDLDCSESIGISKDGFSDGISGNGIGQFSLSNGVGMVAGEHPFGEHPSRTLFVRNINSNVEDSELKTLFEQYGDIRTLYTACKHRGFVMISYYDIRAARTAMRALQNKPLRRRKLDIHFSIPKDNPSEKDINQGTLVVFNLDASVSNEELRQIFGAYGEVKEIRETPHKRHHKFIEFYDVRAAEGALRALNRCDIAGKRIKLEPSRPGGARRNLMQQLNQDLDQDEVCSFRNNVGSPLANSPPGNWPQFGSPVECTPLQTMNESPNFGSLSPVNANGLSGLASILPKIAPIGKDHSAINHVNQVFSNVKVTPGTMGQHSHSFPDQKLLGLCPGPISPSNPIPNSNSNSGSNPNSSGIGTLSGPQFLWGSPSPNSFPWSSTSSLASPISSSCCQGHSCLSYHSRHNPFLGSHHHHVGSAPSGIPMDRHFRYFPESPEISFLPPVGYRGINNGGGYLMNMGTGGSPVTENGLPGFRMIPLTRHGLFFPSNGSYSDGMVDRNNRSRRVDNNGGGQMENKKQYQLDLDKIISGEDSKTTLMIKNIPNKYTSKMLLAAIDENHRGAYDFLYLPIDFKNKCNVGYAFINMVSPSHIIPFYEAFNGKRWEKFNSEKVASLAYARIQGKTALISHFQNSSLMNEDKRCRPILFHSEGQEIVDQEPLPSSNLNICIRQPDGSYCGDSLESPDENETG